MLVDWPCNEGKAPQGNVILLTGEDDPADTAVPRRRAAGADLDRIEIVRMVHGADNRRVTLARSFVRTVSIVTHAQMRLCQTVPASISAKAGRVKPSRPGGELVAPFH